MLTLLRSALFNLVFHGGTLVLGLFALPLLLGSRRAAHWAVRAWAKSMLVALRLVAGVTVRIEGREHLPASGPMLVAAKHQSAFDTIVWLTLLPDVAYVMKRELLRIPFYGWFAVAAGMIPVDRQGGAAAMRQLLRTGREAFDRGRQVVIFPEGSRLPPGTSTTYHPGVAALAQIGAVPVIPAATDSGRFWGRNAFRKHAGTITLRILPALRHDPDRRAFLDRLRETIEREQRELGA